MSKKIIPFKKYELPCQLRINRVNSFGQGIALLDDYEIYVDGALEGEELIVNIGDPFANGSKRRPGSIVSFVNKSKDRAESLNGLEHPGLYAYAHMTYEASLRKKQSDIVEAVKKTGLNPDCVTEVVPCDISKPSRFKSIRHFALKDGKIVNGYYKSRSHEVIEICDSKFEPQWFSFFSNDLCELFTRLNISVYDEYTSKGNLRALFLRDTIEGRLCTLVVSDNLNENQKDEFIQLSKKYKVDSVYLNINKHVGNKVFSDDFVFLSGIKKVELPLCGYRYLAGPNTFLQVNYPVAEKLYSAAVEWCGKDSDSTAIDLCCGVGTMTLCLSKSFKEVLGLEIVRDSILAAQENAILNHIDNVSFEVSDITKGLPKSFKNKNIKAVICDPARAGIGERACNELSHIKGNFKMAYIFCSLTALTRDLKTLVSNGFTVEEIRGFDMFPFSSHVETLVLLSKNN